jgi:hypothetical protein
VSTAQPGIASIGTLSHPALSARRGVLRILRGFSPTGFSRSRPFTDIRFAAFSADNDFAASFFRQQGLAAVFFADNRFDAHRPCRYNTLTT